MKSEGEGQTLYKGRETEGIREGNKGGRETDILMGKEGETEANRERERHTQEQGWKKGVVEIQNG